MIITVMDKVIRNSMKRWVDDDDPTESNSNAIDPKILSY